MEARTPASSRLQSDQGTEMWNMRTGKGTARIDPGAPCPWGCLLQIKPLSELVGNFWSTFQRCSNP